MSEINDVVGLHNRALGFSFQKTYDVALKRLGCVRLDDFILTGTDCRSNVPILACKFAEVSGFQNIFAVANEDGAIVIKDVNKRHRHTSETVLNGHCCHYNAIFDLAWKFDEMKLASASGDHTVRLYDIRESALQEIRLFVGHERSVKTVAFQNGTSLIASGGRDSSIYIWDTRMAPTHVAMMNVDYPICRPDSVINCSNMPAVQRFDSTHVRGRTKHQLSKSPWNNSRVNSITGLVFQDDYTLISACAGDSSIRCWDMRKTYSVYNKQPHAKHTFSYKGTVPTKGYTNLVLDNNSNRLYASCVDNIVYCYNLSSYAELPVMTYAGHRAGNSYYIKTSLSPDNKYILSGSSDEKAYIWNINNEEPLLVLEGHEAEVTCVAWCHNDPLILVTCSDDSNLKIWRIHNEGANNSFEGRAKSSNKLIKNHTSRHIEWMEKVIDTPQFEGNIRWNGKRYISLEKTANVKRVRRLFTPEKKRPADFHESETKRFRYDTDVTFLTSKLELNSITERNELAERFTSNLPNFVVDGTAPHLRIVSPQKPKENKDWISKLRVEKELRRRMLDETGGGSDDAGPSSPKLSRPDDIKVKTPSRRLSKAEVGSPRAYSPLLRYFKINKTTD